VFQELRVSHCFLRVGEKCVWRAHDEEEERQDFRISKVVFEHAKEEIRSRINIADIIGRHVALKTAGQNLKGLCPFHKEKTPSFTVTPAKGIFYCFGCHKGGDVFTFLMEFEGLSFSEALHMLADEAGVKLEQPRSQSAYQSADMENSNENEKDFIPKNQ